MFASRNRVIIAKACLISAIALTAAFFIYTFMFPSPERYTSIHKATPAEALRGFGAESVFNIGDADQLDIFPGIGNVLAERIVEGRDIFGDYFLPTDLLLVKGIGPKTLEGMMDVLTEPLVPREE